MRNYRIREIEVGVSIYQDFDTSIGYTIKKYVVEKRFLWFWWIQDNLGLADYGTWNTFEEARNFIYKRGGKLLFTI